ncbi:MAG: cytidylate kinase-like family protein [Melioribacteraceae bacterium]|nr:cytidylate kinase-like family protein [Melioribacteraceae bacterium]
MIPLDGYAKAKRYVDSHAKLTEQEIATYKKKYPGPCLTISRQSGIDTNSLSEKLVLLFKNYYSEEWAYFDNDLIKRVIADHGLSPRIQKFLSEERESTISQMFNELLGIHPPIIKLVRQMMDTILNLAEFGHLILIGRGSNIVTSHLNNSYHIRLVAPFENRIKCIQKSKNLNKDLAKKMVLKEDHNRKDYLYRTFKKNIDDPLLYNMIINTSQFSFDDLIKSIFEAVKTKYPINGAKYKTVERLKGSRIYA